MRVARFGPIPVDEEQRFWAKVEKTDSCWLWKGTTSRGYGNFRVGSLATRTRRKVLAHRYSYELVHGSIDSAVMVIHSCDVRRCVNPAHLRPGDHKLNAADAKARERLHHPDHRDRRNPNYRHGRYVVRAEDTPEPTL